MSGGFFEFPTYKLDEMVSNIEDYITGHEIDDDEMKEVKFAFDHNWITKEEFERLCKNRHTDPNENGFDQVTIDEFKKAINTIKIASIYINRIDYLMSGDDSEESFHRRLNEELGKVMCTVSKK